ENKLGDKAFKWYVHRGKNGELKYDYARGIDLEYLIETMAGLDNGSIKRYSIKTEDNYIENNRDIDYNFLFGTKRYYFPDAYKNTLSTEDIFKKKIVSKPILAVESLESALTF